MKFSSEDIAQHLRLGEDSTREFKQLEFKKNNELKSPRRDKLADEIAAFANAEGGLLFCGVTDDAKVQGMESEQLAKLDAVLVEISSDSVAPAVRIRTDHVEYEGKRLLIVEVPQGLALHESPGGNFVRVGGTTRRMTSEESLRLSQNRGKAQFVHFDEQLVQDTGFQALDESLWKPLLSAEGALDPKSALRKLGLLTVDEHDSERATVGGILLCSRAPEQWLQSATITATFYRGTDRSTEQLDAQEITGSLNRQIDNAVSFVIKNMRIAARKAPGRIDVPQYSDKAVFEAVVNAVAHRDYMMRSSKIRLSMFADRLEIQSPGTLPNNLTLDSMADRQATRNEILTSVLGRMRVQGIRGSEDRQCFMERRGDGVSIIRRKTWETCGKEPEYRLIDNAEVLLVIPAAELKPGSGVVTIPVSDNDGPLAGAQLLAAFPNNTSQYAVTNAKGQATIALHSTHLPMKVFVAAPGVAAHCERDWVPEDRQLAVRLEPLPAGGAVIMQDGTGRLPGLNGRINPILDSIGRTYLYASNISINEGMQHPVYFLFGEWLRLIDAAGNELMMRIVDIAGQTALVEYRPCAPGD